jgi:hypothetical protein
MARAAARPKAFDGQKNVRRIAAKGMGTWTHHIKARPQSARDFEKKRLSRTTSAFTTDTIRRVYRSYDRLLTAKRLHSPA